eukprot:CAMPEP_0202050030 /NCGR_PEP_ID=MMETSP0963-20130614/3755_1 /ASSEMBLY_ACC=CAM_ASM_000494 /TAXON_ID=4773 /ORGANISM="Schizochytrium aggregatum, Strain ATCC28209" /LENGTH=87 /DNA_ID=CAMNT_0048615095 /DNA_START=40 /DNA_END=300 /DNA_ORIENTATION=+
MAVICARPGISPEWIGFAWPRALRAERQDAFVPTRAPACARSEAESLGGAPAARDGQRLTWLARSGVTDTGATDGRTVTRTRASTGS